MSNERALVPFPSGLKVNLATKGHENLLRLVIADFIPRFAPDATLAYFAWCDVGYLHETNGLEGLDFHDHHYLLLPDIVIHSPARNVVFAIQTATRGDGPISADRYEELEEIFEPCKVPVVFVSAFFAREDLVAAIADLSPATSVWVADAPDELIALSAARRSKRRRGVRAGSPR